MHKRHQFRCKPAPLVHHIAVEMVMMMTMMGMMMVMLVMLVMTAHHIAVQMTMMMFHDDDSNH